MAIISLFKLDKLLSMINNSLCQVLEQILVYETKDAVDRLIMFHVINLRFVLRFLLKSNLYQGLIKKFYYGFIMVLLNRTL